MTYSVQETYFKIGGGTMSFGVIRDQSVKIFVNQIVTKWSLDKVHIWQGDPLGIYKKPFGFCSGQK